MLSFYKFSSVATTKNNFFNNFIKINKCLYGFYNINEVIKNELRSKQKNNNKKKACLVSIYKIV